MQSNLFAFPDVGVRVAPPSSLPFPTPLEFRCAEPVGESERGRFFPLPFLCGSCLNANESPNEHWPFVIQRIHSRSCCWHLLCLSLSHFLCSELLLQVSISRFEMRILDFLLEMSLGHQRQSATVVFLLADCRLLTVDLQKIVRLLQLFNLHLVQTLQHVVSRSVSDC